METQRAPSREERVAFLRARDGDFCKHPVCGKPLDFTLVEEDSPGRNAVTIDHWHPQAHGGGWEYDNLKLMHKSCNQLKGDMVPYADGTLPERKASNFRRRAEKRSGRLEVCDTCMSGRKLGFQEICDDCGSGPQPESFPTIYKLKPKDCPHAGPWWCWACTGIGLYQREPASKTVFDGDYFDD